MRDRITLDPGLDGADRRALAAYMHEVAARTKTNRGPLAVLLASLVHAIGAKLEATATGPVEVNVRPLSRDQRGVTRRILWTAADRARDGRAGVSGPVREATAMLLDQWERQTGYDAAASWSGPRNMWNEAPEPARRAGAMFASNTASP